MDLSPIAKLLELLFGSFSGRQQAQRQAEKDEERARHAAQDALYEVVVDVESLPNPPAATDQRAIGARLLELAKAIRRFDGALSATMLRHARIWNGAQILDPADWISRFEDTLVLLSQDMPKKAQLQASFFPIEERLADAKSDVSLDYMTHKVGIDSPVGRLNVDPRQNGSFFIRLTSKRITRAQLKRTTGLVWKIDKAGAGIWTAKVSGEELLALITSSERKP